MPKGLWFCILPSKKGRGDSWKQVDKGKLINVSPFGQSFQAWLHSQWRLSVLQGSQALPEGNC